jgi:hypothetical protein
MENVTQKVGYSDGIAHLLTEELLMPSQFAEVYGRSRELDPERKLLNAILEQALKDLQKAAERADAREWFEADATEWGSFQYVCDVLPGLNADALLRGLRGCNWRPGNLGHRCSVSRMARRPSLTRNYKRENARRDFKAEWLRRKEKAQTLILIKHTADGSEGKETAFQQVPPYPPRSGCQPTGRSKGNSDAPSKSLERDAS